MKGLYKDFGIYGIHCIPTDKFYIGKTQASFGDRRDCHYAMLRNGYHYSKELQEDFTKYGENNFEFIVVETISDKKELNEAEKKWIGVYRESGKVYNIADGGDEPYLKGRHMSEETKRKIGAKNRINMLGRKDSAITRLRKSEAQKRRYATTTLEEKQEFARRMTEATRGISWSDERRKKYSESQYTNPHGAKYAPELIKKIRYMYEEDNKTNVEIAEELNIPKGTIAQITSYRRWKHLA